MLPEFLIARDNKLKKYLVSTRNPRFIAKVSDVIPKTRKHYALSNGLYIYDISWIDAEPIEEAMQMFLFKKIEQFYSNELPTYYS